MPNLPAVAQHTGSTTMGRIGAGVGVNLVPWPPVQHSPYAYPARAAVYAEQSPQYSAAPYAGAYPVWQVQGGPQLYTEQDYGYAGADVRTQTLVNAAMQKRRSVRRVARKRRKAARAGMTFTIGQGPGKVMLTADPGIGILNRGGRQTYVRILGRRGNVVTVRPTQYAPGGFSGGQLRPAYPSYPGHVGAHGHMGNRSRGYAGGHHHDHDHDHDHGGACCESCANGGGCEGCDGNCGPDCGCKG